MLSREVTAVEWTCAECAKKFYEVDEVRIPGIYVSGEVITASGPEAVPFTESFLCSHECACMLLKRKLGLLPVPEVDPAVNAGYESNTTP